MAQFSMRSPFGSAWAAHLYKKNLTLSLHCFMTQYRFTLPWLEVIRPKWLACIYISPVSFLWLIPVACPNSSIIVCNVLLCLIGMHTILCFPPTVIGVATCSVFFDLLIHIVLGRKEKIKTSFLDTSINRYFLLELICL